MSFDQMAPETLVEQWRTRPSSPGQPLSPGSQAVYASIFLAFCRHLAPRPWQEATAADVVAYCQQLRPKMRSPRPSPATVHRYHRVLGDFFSVAQALAQEQGCSWTHPTRGQARPPEIHHSAEVPSTVLHSGHLAQLRQGLTMGGDWLEAREQAILALLLETALTRAEVCALRTADLQGARLQVNGPRAAQSRGFSLSDRTLRLLTHHLAFRRGQAAASDALFVNERGDPASSQVVFNVVTRAIDAVLAGQGAAHHGPNVLRNAVIQEWVAQEGLSDAVALRAGLSRAASLRRLAP